MTAAENFVLTEREKIEFTRIQQRAMSCLILIVMRQTHTHTHTHTHTYIYIYTTPPHTHIYIHTLTRTQQQTVLSLDCAKNKLFFTF